MKKLGSSSTFVPRSAPATVGNTTPHSTTKVITTSTRLVYKKADSLESGSSSLFSDLNSDRRDTMTATEKMTAISRKNVNQGMKVLSENAWTEVAMPGAGEERAEDGEQEGDRHENDRPDQEHLPSSQHDHRMDQSGGREPRHQGGVLHRVPGPVASPTQGHVGPPGSHQVADGQEEPAHQRPAAHRRQPGGARAARQEPAHGQREGDGQANVAEVERDGVYHHARVLQHGVHALAVGGTAPRTPGRRGWNRCPNTVSSEKNVVIASRMAVT